MRITAALMRVRPVLLVVIDARPLSFETAPSASLPTLPLKTVSPVVVLIVSARPVPTFPSTVLANTTLPVPA